MTRFAADRPDLKTRVLIAFVAPFIVLGRPLVAFVWALPQVCRDGYIRLAPTEDDDMQAFDDVLYPLALGAVSIIASVLKLPMHPTAGVRGPWRPAR